MGLYSFIKSAGEMLGLGGDETPDADAIKKEIDKHDIGSRGVNVEVQGEKAVITGEVSDQSALEKIIVAAGNIVGISEVETKVEAPAPREPKFYTVQKGDTLSAIAKSEMGSANKYPEIFEANKPMLKHPDKIYPGQVLRIPQD